MDNVGAALYVRTRKPSVKSIAGINQNYAWGQDSWGDFELAMKVLVPNIEVEDLADAEALRRPVRRRDLGAARRKPDVIHSSFWDGDLEALHPAGGRARLMKQSLTVLTTGETAMHKLGNKIPDGTVLGARGPFGLCAEQPATTSGSRRLRRQVQASAAELRLLPDGAGVPRREAAWEKAQDANGGKKPERRAGRRGAEGLDLRSARRHGAHGDRRRPPGDHGDRLRHDQARRGQADGGQTSSATRPSR